MNFDLSEDQELFKATAERFVASVDVEARKQLRSHDGGYDRKRWSELADLGFLALSADEAQGGMGGSLTDLAVIAEALGQGNAVDPWLENGVLPARLLSRASASEMLEPFIEGNKIAALAFAEPKKRYSLTPTATVAKKTGDGYVISGEKTFVLGGALADALLVTADVEGTTAVFLISCDNPNVHRRSYCVVDGSLASEVRLLDVEVSASARLDLDGDALTAIVAEMRLLAAAEMLGLAQRLFDDTVAYVKQREQFGVAIGTFQVIQHGLVDCYALVEQMRSLLLRTILAPRDDVETWQGQYAGAKAFIGDGATTIAKKAVQFHGGMGITDELAVGHAVKRIILLDRLFGDAASNLAEYAEAA